MNANRLLLMLIVLSSLASSWFLRSNPHLGPKIVITEPSYDFGSIKMGTRAEHTFLVQNAGSDSLIIASVQPSCGCTGASMTKQRLGPGDTSSLLVIFDTRGKAAGAFSKWVNISSNDTTARGTRVEITGKIEENKGAHEMTMHIMGVFQGDCAKCHVDKGVGLLGQELFQADCAICHGEKSDNKPGPALATAPMLGHDAKSLGKIIREGIHNSNMPGFSKAHGGPLSDDQIASLLEYISSVKRHQEAERKTLSKFTSPKG